MKMREAKQRKSLRADGGFTLLEVVGVLGVVAIFFALAIPQMVSSRRLIRSANIPREVTAQLRLARQQAISQRRAVTFQYDDTTKRIRVINHGPNSGGTAILTATGYPNTSGSFVMTTIMLTSGGLPATEIAYGIPTGVPNDALGDTTTATGLTNNRVNITFQPDGSVLNSAGATTNHALFFHNPYSPVVKKQTAVAVSVLGTAGRVKSWRYISGANKFHE